MRLAVLSDIHGNLVALEAALADLEALGGADQVWILGDLAALGARPAECVRRIRELRDQLGKDKCHIIGGNTDRYMVTGERMRGTSAKDAEAFAKLAADWQDRDTIMNWGVAQLSYEDYELLRDIRGRETALNVAGYGHVIGYHAIPGNDETFIFPTTSDEEALDALLDREGRLGIGGHTHHQMNRDLGRWRMVNVGSVGWSFDVPGKVEWGLFTFENGEVEIDLRCFDYDVDAAIADLHAAGHPNPQRFARHLRPNL